MKFHGSLQNRIMENSNDPRKAGTVVEVEIYRKRRMLTVQRDKVTRVDKNGISESQEYTFERDENGPKYKFWESKTGHQFNEYPGGGYGLLIGERDEYYDPSF